MPLQRRAQQVQSGCILSVMLHAENKDVAPCNVCLVCLKTGARVDQLIGLCPEIFQNMICTLNPEDLTELFTSIWHGYCGRKDATKSFKERATQSNVFYLWFKT